MDTVIKQEEHEAEHQGQKAALGAKQEDPDTSSTSSLQQECVDDRVVERTLCTLQGDEKQKDPVKTAETAISNDATTSDAADNNNGDDTSLFQEHRQQQQQQQEGVGEVVTIAVVTVLACFKSNQDLYIHCT
jgi:hypothetical protein